jgi:hypothetical protein
VKVYQTKIKRLPGTDYREVYPKAFSIYKEIRAKTKRRPYLRSAYFNKEKVFIDYFWQHLWQKIWPDRFRRLKYYACAIDLIQNSRAEPVSKPNPNRPREILHRFAGLTPEKDLFHVQISEDTKTGRKDFTSVFPDE